MNIPITKAENDFSIVVLTSLHCQATAGKDSGLLFSGPLNRVDTFPFHFWRRKRGQEPNWELG